MPRPFLLALLGALILGAHLALARVPRHHDPREADGAPAGAARIAPGATERWGGALMPRPFFLALLGALILGSAIVALNLAEHDQARMIERPCGALHWSPGALPVRVRVDESAADWTAELQTGAAAWNRAAGREVLTVEPALPTEWTTFADAFAGIGPEPSGAVLVVSGRGQGSIVRADDEDGHARIRWRLGLCTIAYAAIRVPDGEPLPKAARLTMAVHELGHALGMDHSRDPLSVMAAEVMRPKPGSPRWEQTITDDDAVLARGVGIPKTVEE